MPRSSASGLPSCLPAGIGQGNEVVLLTRYEGLSMWERTRAWSADPPEGVDPELWRRAREAIGKRQELAESTHARVLSPSKVRAL